MKARTALLLLVLGIVVAAGGWYFGLRGQDPVVSPGAGQAAFPGLVGKLAAADKVELLQGGKPLTLQRKGEVWGIMEKSGYPALPERLHSLFVNLSELRLVEPRTANPDLLDRLGLTDPKAAGSTAGLVRVLDAKGAPMAELVVGHKRAGGDGATSTDQQVYVRRPSENQSWLADGAVDVITNPGNWMAHDLSNIDRGKIASVTVTRPGTPPLTFTATDGKLALTTPADHPPLDVSKLDDVARGLEFLTGTDVVAADKQPGTPVGSSVFKTIDGLTVTATVTKQGNDPWVALAATGQGDAAEQAKDLEKLFNGWAYEIGSWKQSALVPSLDDLKPAPPAPPPAPEKTTP